MISARMKDTSREGRLSFRNFAEHQMRREFKDQAISACRDPIHAFGKCAMEQGLLVVFNCRSFQREMNDCMKLRNSDEEFQKYLEIHKDDLNKRTIRS